MKNWPSLLDLRARTGWPLWFLISRMTLGTILLVLSRVMPAIRLGFSGF